MELFMEGITVLNTIEHAVKGWGWSWVGFICAILGCLFMIIGIELAIRDLAGSTVDSIVTILGFILFIASLVVFKNGKQIDAYYTYEVTIDDSISFIEFDNKYEILEHRGDIYEIKERGQD